MWVRVGCKGELPVEVGRRGSQEWKRLEVSLGVGRGSWCWGGDGRGILAGLLGPRQAPVQQLPVLAAPLVAEFLCVHATHAVEVGLVDPEEAESVHLPVTWGGDNL